MGSANRARGAASGIHKQNGPVHPKVPGPPESAVAD